MNIKRIISVLFFAVISALSLLVLTSCAGGGSSANKLKYEMDTYGNSYTLVGANLSKSDTDVVIPSEYKGLPVSGIADYAFDGEHNLRSITIPASVEYIGNGIFANCKNLSMIAIESENTKYSCYGNCIIEIKTNELIAGCANSVIPKGGIVTSIAENAFLGCSNLETLEIPEGVTSIGRSAFYDCINLKYLSIPTSVTYIAGYAFENCDSLISIEDGVHYVDKWVVDCDEYTVDIVIRNGTVGIREGAFMDSVNIKSVFIPDGVLYIGSFFGCSSLESIRMPGYALKISDSAFYNCRSLKSIDIPNGITVLPSSVFRACESLMNVKLPDGLKTIEYEAFYGCKILQDVSIPSTVTEIGTSAFEGCKCIEEILLPDGLKDLEMEMFKGCTALRSVNIPSGVITIGCEIFSGCENLQRIFIPISVTGIGYDAFKSCSSLTIYAQADSRGEYWDQNFNPSGCPIAWGSEPSTEN